MLLCPVQAPLRITQRYGVNKQDYAQYGLAGHDGVDMTGPVAGVSVPVYAPCNGTIYVAGTKPGYLAYGNAVSIMTPPDSTGRRAEVILGHHSAISVRVGQYIHMGEQVGMMGQTGAARGIHCHLGIRFWLPDGTIENFNNNFHGWIDPLPLVLFWLKNPQLAPFVSFPNG